MISDAQQDLFRVWAHGTGFVVDLEKSPKAEFSRLAKVKGWVGGDAVWCARWNECFKEAYSHPSKTAKVTVREATPDIADRMRRLSIGSASSEFSVISRASKTDSIASVRSLNSEGSQDSVLSYHSVQSITGGVNILTIGEHVESKSERTAEPGESKSERTSDEQCRHGAARSHAPRTAMSQWYQPGFKPSPTTPFKDEFNRLAQFKGWSKDQRRAEFVSMLNLEIAYHFEGCMHVLKRHQDLCEDLGMEDIPTTITQCKKAIKSFNVNIFHLIDHKRNPESVLRLYSTPSELRKSLRNKGNRVPKQCAKADGIIKVLLKKV